MKIALMVLALLAIGAASAQPPTWQDVWTQNQAWWVANNPATSDALAKAQAMSTNEFTLNVMQVQADLVLPKAYMETQTNTEANTNTEVLPPWIILDPIAGGSVKASSYSYLDGELDVLGLFTMDIQSKAEAKGAGSTDAQGINKAQAFLVTEQISFVDALTSTSQGWTWANEKAD